MLDDERGAPPLPTQPIPEQLERIEFHLLDILDILKSGAGSASASEPRTLERFDFIRGHVCNEGDCVAEMEKSADGDFVRYDDVTEFLQATEPRRDEREAFEAYRRSTMSDWKEAQDAALTKDLAPDGKTIRYRHDLVEAQWQTWQAARASAAPLKQTASDILNRKRLHHDTIERVLIEQYFAGKSQGYTLETADKIAEALNFPTVNVPDLFNDWKMRTYKKNCYGRDDMIAFGITVMRKCEVASLPQPSLPQENADSLNTNSVAGDGLKTTPSAGQTEGK